MTRRTHEENYVLEMARQYARVKLNGVYVEKGQLISMHHSTKTQYEEHFAWKLLDSAERLLRVMATDEIDGKLVP